MRPIEALLNRVEKEELLRYYRIADFSSQEQFLGQIARKKGYLQAGGIANFDQAARSVLRDFLNGKLKYFTAPPLFDLAAEEEDDDVDMK